MDRSMIARLSKLSPRAKAAMVIAIILLAPFAGWLGYRIGLFLGHH